MSKTGDYLIGKIDEISVATGYDAAWLWARYFTVLNEFEAGYHTSDEDPLVVLEKYAVAKVWGEPEHLGKSQSFDFGERFICDPTSNTKCNHRNCVLFGGDCFMTREREFSGVGVDGLPEKATPRKILEMKSLIQTAKKETKPKPDALLKFETTSSFFNESPAKVTILDPETTKIRKHTHDILWAVIAGLIAGAGLVVVIGLIIIGVLSYARG